MAVFLLITRIEGMTISVLVGNVGSASKLCFFSYKIVLKIGEERGTRKQGRACCGGYGD